MSSEEPGHGVALTNLDELLFEGAGATKRDLVDYLEAVADRILPVLEERPLSVIRVVRGQPPKLTLRDDQHEPAQVRSIHQRGDHHGLVVDQARRGHRDVHLASGGQRHAPLHLHRHVRAIGQAVKHPVDAFVPQRQEHVQPAHRLPHQLAPHLELRDLPRGQRLPVVPADVSLHSATILALNNLGWRGPERTTH